MANFKCDTKVLQTAVTKSIKAAGFNKLLPITSMIGIRKFGDRLNLTTTDGTNYLYVDFELAEGDEFSIVVDGDKFAKLVSKLTSDSVELEVLDNTLVISGNGEYKLALELNDDGNILEFPNPFILSEVDFDNSVTVDKSVVDVMLNSIKPSLSTQTGNIYTHYYVGDVIVGTDRAMFSSFDNSSLNVNRLLTREFVDLLGLMSDKIELVFGSEDVVAKSGNLLLYAKQNVSSEGFKSDKIREIISTEMDSFCRVNKQSLLSTLERIAIFVGEFDDSAIKLNFTKDGLEISSMSTNGIELVDYMEYKFDSEFSAKISITRFITLLKSYSSDSVDIYFGNEKMLKLKDGKLTQVIAYML